MNRIFIILLLATVFLFSTCEKPPMTVLIETEFGNITAVLYDETPQHRDNFVKLANEGFYDDLLFHRVINGFMIQGGDPDSKGAPMDKMLGMGGPGYTIPAEFLPNKAHIKGALCAARQPDNVNPQKASSGSQFYIVQGRPVPEQQLAFFEKQLGITLLPEIRQAYIEKGGAPQLDQQYTVFGEVIEGFDVIDKIATVQTERPSNRPVEDIKMKVKVVK